MTALLIPAYEPDQRLLGLIDDLHARRWAGPIVVVDDGSGERFRAIFDAARARGCVVLVHQRNHGKGAALKTGFGHIATVYPGHAVVCADCDGQHVPTDIQRVAAALGGRPDAFVLGARQFVGEVPARSRFGNTITRVLFARSTGRHVHDTQTGLRAYPADALSWLRSVPGQRFEYELDVLLQAGRAGWALEELPIRTVYLDDNESSHFRTVTDSVLVYRPLLRFSLSSLATFGLDVALVLSITAATGNLALAVVTARSASATLNFAANRRFVFDAGGTRPPRNQAKRYALLATAVLVGNYALLAALRRVVGLPLLTAKLVTELVLFLTSYRVQRRVVFAPAGPAVCAEPALAAERAVGAEPLAPVAPGELAELGELRDASRPVSSSTSPVAVPTERVLHETR